MSSQIRAPPTCTCSLSLKRATYSHLRNYQNLDIQCITCTFMKVNQFAPEDVYTGKTFLWHKSGWRVYTHLLLGVNSTMAKWFRTIGTANNEWVHSLCWYLPNPFIEHLFFWRSSQGFVKTDLYPLYRGFSCFMYEIPSFRPCPSRRVGRCFELANGLILPRKTTVTKKLAIRFSKCQWKRHLFGCPDLVSLKKNLLMARIFFGFLAKNKPVWVSGKTKNIPGANWLRCSALHITCTCTCTCTCSSNYIMKNHTCISPELQ